MFLALNSICFAAVMIGINGQEWGQWRGPGRDGVVAPVSVPKVWPDSLKKSWRVELGEGYSSPVMMSGRIFVHHRRDPEEIITAVDSAGKMLWEKKYPAPFTKNQYATKMMKGPFATPLAADGRLFTLGATGVLTAWNAEDGSLAWRKDFSDSVETAKLFCGTAASPLMEGGSLIIQVGSDVKGGRILALNPASGEERWAWKGPGPGYASPTVITAGGIRQIVSLTESSIIGVDAKSGAELWSHPFPDEWQENIVTPLWTGLHLIVSGTRQGTRGFTLKQTGGKWSLTQAWENPGAAMYMSSPVFADGVIYAHSNKKRGHFAALDPATGDVKWASEGRDGDIASLMLTPGHVVCINNAGSLRILKRNPLRYEEMRRYEVGDSEVWATPILLADGLIVRDSRGLIRYAFQGPQAASAR
jgi:outer membrane protein assembly factor BamB